MNDEAVYRTAPATLGLLNIAFPVSLPEEAWLSDHKIKISISEKPFFSQRLTSVKLDNSSVATDLSLHTSDLLVIPPGPGDHLGQLQLGVEGSQPDPAPAPASAPAPAPALAPTLPGAVVCREQSA